MNMIRDGERTGKLTRDKVILDATSGNTGIAYAMIGAYLGYKVKLCLPKNASMERKHVLQAYGAEMVFSDPGEGSDGAIRLCQEIYKADPERYFYPDQYNNPANWKAHYNGTALEILAQTDGRITHFVASMGTSGTFMGNTRRLREEVPGIKCISAQPSSGFPWPGRLEAHADRDCSGHLRSVAGRRKYLDRNRGRLCACAAAWLAKKRCWPASLRERTWWRPRKLRGRLADAGRARRDRHGALRRRLQISERALLA